MLAQGAPAAGKELTIDAAADLQPVMPVLAQAYEKKTGVKLNVVIGSSGTLVTQILNGAPADVFLGADFTFPEKVVAANLATGKAARTLCEGHAGAVVEAQPGCSAEHGPAARPPGDAGWRSADEFHAPFGRAAYAALRWLKIEDKVKPKLVVAENVAQTAQFVESGNAQMGFISLTLASSDKLKAEGQYVRVPEDLSGNPPVRRGAEKLEESG